MPAPGILARLVWLGRPLGLDPLDLWFVGLRIGTFAAGLIWCAEAPADVRASLVPILAAFLVFSAWLYVWNALRPGRIASLYRVALGFDLAVVFFLLRITGGYASDLHLAYILLIALHAFYFGLATGLAAAAVSAGLYALAVGWPLPMPGFALRAAFFVMVGLCMGVVAEQARRRQMAIEDQQEQLMRSDRLATVGELAAGLAHELRNPLAGISGALHVLGSELDAADPRRALLGDVQGQIARMNKTLTDLLQHARPAEPQRIGVDINAVLEQSLRFLPRGAIDVVRRLDDDLPPLLVDPNLLHQAFLNILVNARQAMPQGGLITLATRFDDRRGAVQVRISDSGSGIRTEDIDRIFQPFFTTKTQGTGLGLAIAARIVEQHGGRIDVESAPDQGATFTITLPAPPVPRLERSEYAIQGAHRR